MVEEHAITFIGPSPDHIRLMGDKIAAKKAIADAGIPVVPGSDGEVTSLREAQETAAKIGYPILIKASAGGGGRGMKVAEDSAGLKEAYLFSRTEAEQAFGNGAVYMEKFLVILATSRFRFWRTAMATSFTWANVIVLCSDVIRRFLEEAPSPALNRTQSDAIGETVTHAMRAIGYKSAGTIEFLFEDGEFYFIEMNTRLQVEHPVTEMICGVDLVREMIRVASGAPLGFKQSDIRFHGHAMECRINAEDPWSFNPSPGQIGDYHAPGGLGVRVDSGLYSGYAVPPYYDSMIAKLIVHGTNRNECLMRLRRALGEFVIDGISTSIPLHQALMRAPDFMNGDYDIHWLEAFVGEPQGET